MHRSRLIGFTLAACSLWASLAFGDNAVLYWNQQVLDATRLSRNPPPIASHNMATCHAAIFDAVDGINRNWKPWLVQETAPTGADMDAAIASKRVTYDFARLMDNAIEVKCSEFADVLIENL